LFKIISVYLIVSLIIINWGIIYAQEEDSSNANGVSWFPIPFAFYTPETRLAFGAMVITAFKLSESVNRSPSSVTALGFYTLNKQYDFSLSPEIYFNSDKFLAASDLNYAKVIAKYYGIGNDTEEIDEPDYEARNSLIFLKFQTEILHYLRLGVVFELRNFDVVDARENPYLLSGTVIGSEGGLTSGVGLVLTFDSRNNIFYPTNGGYYEFATAVFSGTIGSDYNYTKTFIDLRRYLEINNIQVLAVQLLYNFVTVSAPFYDMPLLGGDEIMRGYFRGRYRDNHYVAAQLEYRIRVWWRFGLVGFIGAGDVADNISKFEMSKFKYSVGAGLRFRIDENELWDLRVDVGFGKESNGFYFQYNQAF
jgi:outer membrane protein assembly factor BamA